MLSCVYRRSQQKYCAMTLHHPVSLNISVWGCGFPAYQLREADAQSVLWITIEMQPLCVPSRGAWYHTTSQCCSNHMWQCCCMSAHAVTCQSQHAVRVSLTPLLPQLITNAWVTVNAWDFWRGFKFSHNIVHENSSLQEYEILLFCKQVPTFPKVLFLCKASSQNWEKRILAS